LQTIQPKVFYSLNPKQFMVPASNNKLITSSALFALTNVSTFTYKTPIYISESTGSTPDNICVKGKGDPSISYGVLSEASSRIRSMKVFNINSIVLDQSFFYGAGDPFPSSWEWEDLQADYGAQPRSLVVNENAVTVTVVPGPTVGSKVSLRFLTPAEKSVVRVINNAITLTANATATLQLYYPLGSDIMVVEGGLPLGSPPSTNPMGIVNSTYHFSKMFHYALETNGVYVHVADGQSGKCDDPEKWKPLIEIESKPLSLLMNYTLQISDNLYAEIFLRTTGAFFASKQNSTGSTMFDGIAKTRAVLAGLGVNVDNFIQADGSGLSRHNMVSAQAFVELLDAMFHHPHGDLYRSFLPRLDYRFNGTPAQGKVWAKTGSMTGVRSLSGYVKNDNFPGGFLVFSSIANGNPSASVVDKGVDQIVIFLAQALPC
jgi:D-alanyl-D-alanine carboxypeptidase/D-alanyl-D-alanine-endopeptidase (penicillin-binding protein 4)